MKRVSAVSITMSTGKDISLKPGRRRLPWYTVK